MITDTFHIWNHAVKYKLTNQLQGHCPRSWFINLNLGQTVKVYSINWRPVSQKYITCQVLPSCFWNKKVALSVTRCFQVLLAVTSCFQVLPVVTRCYQQLPGVSKGYQVLLSVTSCYQRFSKDKRSNVTLTNKPMIAKLKVFVQAVFVLLWQDS